MHDSIAAESVPSVGVFPPDWEKLFTGENQYRLEGGGLGLTESHLSIGGRVFAEKGGESAYVLRGARGLRNEAVPLGSDALESVWVRSVLAVGVAGAVYTTSEAVLYVLAELCDRSFF